jgi:hypothetical protein
MMEKLKFSLIYLIIAILVIGPVSFAFPQQAQAGGPARLDGSGLGGATTGSGDDDCSGVVDSFVCIVLTAPMRLGGAVLWFSGVLLNSILEYTISDFAEKIRDLSAINETWRLIRDVINMTFIFVLLYIAIGTILNLERVNWKKTLVAVIIAALLINFSLFFTKLIIDASNTVTLVVYNQIIVCDKKVTSSTVIGLTQSEGLSNCFMNAVGLSSIFDVSSSDMNDVLQQLAGGKHGTLLVISIFAMIFFLIAAFVFLAVTVMFFVRYVIYIFLLILSPIAVIGSVIPKLGDQSKKWWNNLIDQSIFAPFFMIMAWIVLRVVSSIPATRGSLSGLGTGQVDAVDTAIQFFIVSALMIGALIIAKQFSGKAGGWGTKFAGGVMGTGLLGAAAWGGRRSVGALGRGIADSKLLKGAAVDDEGKARRGPFGGLARLTMRGGQATAGASFDVRGVTGSGVGKSLGLDNIGLGKAKKGGYDKYVKDKAEKESKFAESLGPSDIEILRAEQELDKVKNLSNSDPRKIEALRKLEKLKGNKERIVRETTAIEEKKKNDIAKARKSEPMRRAEAAERAKRDEISKREIELASTVDEAPQKIKEEELNIARRQLRDLENETKAIKEEVEREVEEIEHRAKADKTTKERELVESLKERRAKSYAATISTAPPASFRIGSRTFNVGLPSTNRVALFGKIKRSKLQGASNIVRGKKPLDKELKDTLEKYGLEVKEVETKPETPPETPSPASPTT